jgi:hypothetical protein
VDRLLHSANLKGFIFSIFFRPDQRCALHQVAAAVPPVRWHELLQTFIENLFLLSVFFFFFSFVSVSPSSASSDFRSGIALAVGLRGQHQRWEKWIRRWVSTFWNSSFILSFIQINWHFSKFIIYSFNFRNAFADQLYLKSSVFLEWNYCQKLLKITTIGVKWSKRIINDIYFFKIRVKCSSLKQ